jgi:hypothetical protein
VPDACVDKTERMAASGGHVGNKQHGDRARRVAQHPQPGSRHPGATTRCPWPEEAASDAYFVTDLPQRRCHQEHERLPQPGVKVRCSPSTPSRTGRSSSLRAGAAGT